MEQIVNMLYLLNETRKIKRLYLFPNLLNASRFMVTMLKYKQRYIINILYVNLKLHKTKKFKKNFHAYTIFLIL